MKLGRFKLGERIFTGVIVNQNVVNLAQTAAQSEEFKRFQVDFSEMRSLLPFVADVSRMLKTIPVPKQRSYPVTDLQTMAPLADPDKIICIGLNYLDHADESGMTIPEEPIFFSKFKSSIVGPGEPIIIPKVSKQIDYEAELAVVIGKKGKHIPEAKAMEYVAGYTAFNDVSARDLQFRGGQWIKGKALDTFAPLGPYLVTADEIADPHNLKIKLLLNKEVMQDSATDKLIFKIPKLISFLSELFTLDPGDIIATGTPPGVGFTRKPPVFLKPGDEVCIKIEGIGDLTNPVGGE